MPELMSGWLDAQHTTVRQLDLGKLYSKKYDLVRPLIAPCRRRGWLSWRKRFAVSENPTFTRVSIWDSVGLLARITCVQLYWYIS